jgi:hypothetical protein
VHHHQGGKLLARRPRRSARDARAQQTEAATCFERRCHFRRMRKAVIRPAAPLLQSQTEQQRRPRRKSLPGWTSWGTNPRCSRASRRSVCGSPLDKAALCHIDLPDVCDPYIRMATETTGSFAPQRDEREQRLQAGRCQTCAYARAPRRRRRGLTSMPTQSMRTPRSTQSLSPTRRPAPRYRNGEQQTRASHAEGRRRGRIQSEGPGGLAIPAPGHLRRCWCSEPAGSSFVSAPFQRLANVREACAGPAD